MVKRDCSFSQSTSLIVNFTVTSATYIRKIKWLLHVIDLSLTLDSVGRNRLEHPSHQLDRNPQILHKLNLCTNITLNLWPVCQFIGIPVGEKQSCITDPFSFRLVVNDQMLVSDELGDCLHDREDRSIYARLQLLRAVYNLYTIGCEYSPLSCRNLNMLGYGLLSEVLLGCYIGYGIWQDFLSEI